MMMIRVIFLLLCLALRLPGSRSFALAGVPSSPTVNHRRHRCRSTQLATGVYENFFRKVPLQKLVLLVLLPVHSFVLCERDQNPIVAVSVYCSFFH